MERGGAQGVSGEANGARTGGMMNFRQRGPERPRLGKDESRRQGEIVNLAYTLLGGKEEALSFLNITSKVLNARPIDLAMRSDLGFLRVETLLRKMSGKPAPA